MVLIIPRNSLSLVDEFEENSGFSLAIPSTIIGLKPLD
jgi:hypothetical protein